MITLLSLCLICVAAIILIPVVLVLVGLPFLVLFALLPWLLRIAGVVLLLKALFEQPTRWENFMPAVVAFALSILIGWIF
ncbi:phage-shock protein [Intestinimonas massiliensis (ex Afouda et al. 2020)]|uniref:phage-shock protein n=1 Tax=Intestinimonas massiliensis (ex Afouda et al. 2020) TaxID=1673721 RepID=UPI0010321E91|nr:phage-shock protein [Intestinimonas massiliensis (ex Afouda et al. 2020)]